MAAVFLAGMLTLFVYSYYFKLSKNKILYKKLILYFSIMLNIVFISSNIVRAIYIGKFVRFYDWYAVLLLTAFALIIIPSLVYLWKQGTIQYIASRIKIKQ